MEASASRSGPARTEGKGTNPGRQSGPHVHSTVLSPDNKYLFTPDLGLDQIRVYKIDPAKLTFAPDDPPYASVNPGLGSRHFAFGRGERFAYAVCEMG